MMSDKKQYEAYHAWRFEPETKELFDKLLSDSRSTAACRICEWYHNEYRENGYETPAGRLVYTLQDGWLRK